MTSHFHYEKASYLLGIMPYLPRQKNNNAVFYQEK